MLYVILIADGEAGAWRALIRVYTVYEQAMGRFRSLQPVYGIDRVRLIPVREEAAAAAPPEAHAEGQRREYAESRRSYREVVPLSVVKGSGGADFGLEP